jgi:hypothetical protein
LQDGVGTRRKASTTDVVTYFLPERHHSRTGIFSPAARTAVPHVRLNTHAFLLIRNGKKSR